MALLTGLSSCESETAIEPDFGQPLFKYSGKVVYLDEGLSVIKPEIQQGLQGTFDIRPAGLVEFNHKTGEINLSKTLELMGNNQETRLIFDIAFDAENHNASYSSQMGIYLYESLGDVPANLLLKAGEKTKKNSSSSEHDNDPDDPIIIIGGRD